MSKTSIFDDRITRYQRRTELLTILSKAVDEDPSLIPELLEIIQEYSQKDGHPTPEEEVSAASPENDEDDGEDNQDASPSERQAAVTIRKGTPDFLEYKA